MATKSISQLDTAVAVSNGDLFETAVPDVGSATGYISKKHSMAAIADHAANTVVYPALQTTAKTLVGAINEAAQGGGGGGSSTLAGLTDVDISNPTNGQTLVYNATSGKWENGSGGGSAMHNYSTTEHEVGTWIDGKTVYEITIKKENLSRVTTSTVLVPHSDFPSGLDMIIDLNTAYIDATGATWTENTYLNSDSIMVTWIAGSGPDIYRWTQWGSQGPATMTAYVTIQYTKTTS